MNVLQQGFRKLLFDRPTDIPEIIYHATSLVFSPKYTTLNYILAALRKMWQSVHERNSVKCWSISVFFAQPWREINREKNKAYIYLHIAVVNIGWLGLYLLIVGSVTGARWVCLALPVSVMARHSPLTVTWFVREWVSWLLSLRSSISHSEWMFCWILKAINFHCVFFASCLIQALGIS